MTPAEKVSVKVESPTEAATPSSRRMSIRPAQPAAQKGGNRRDVTSMGGEGGTKRTAALWVTNDEGGLTGPPCRTNVVHPKVADQGIYVVNLVTSTG